MRITITFLLIWLSFYSYAGKIEFFDGSPEAAFQKAASEDKLVFVDFYASWCRPCKQLERRTFKNKALISYLNEHYINLRVDVDAPNPFFQSFMKGKLKAIPYLAFFSPTQDQLGSIEGYVEADSLCDYAGTLKKDFLAAISLTESMVKRAEAIAIDLCAELEPFTNIAIQLNETTAGTEEYNKLNARFVQEKEVAETILQGLDEKMGSHLNSQYFIDEFGKSLAQNCIETFKIMQLLVE